MYPVDFSANPHNCCLHLVAASSGDSTDGIYVLTGSGDDAAGEYMPRETCSGLPVYRKLLGDSSNASEILFAGMWRLGANRTGCVADALDITATGAEATCPQDGLTWSTGQVACKLSAVVVATDDPSCATLRCRAAAITCACPYPAPPPIRLPCALPCASSAQRPPCVRRRSARSARADERIDPPLESHPACARDARRLRS